jgi:hypothetical protein
MDLLRSLAEDEGEEMEEFGTPVVSETKKRKKSRNKKKRNKKPPQQNQRTHWDDCVEKRDDEFDFEAELESFSMAIETTEGEHPETREREGEEDKVAEEEEEIGGCIEEDTLMQDSTALADTSNYLVEDYNSYAAPETVGVTTLDEVTTNKQEHAQLTKTEEEQPTYCVKLDNDNEMRALIERKKQELLQRLAEGTSPSKRKREEQNNGELLDTTNSEPKVQVDEEEEQNEGDGSQQSRKKRRRNKTDPSERTFPHHKDEQAWNLICYGSDTRAAEIPTLELIKSLDALTVVTILAYHVSWLGEEDVTAYQANWLYHLLLKVEEPILRDTSADLRELRYRCSCTRAKLENASDDRLNPLNTIITLISKFFNVLDG